MLEKLWLKVYNPQEKKLKVLSYGKPWSWKTHFIWSAIEKFKVLYFTVDKWLSTIYENYTPHEWFTPVIIDDIQQITNLVGKPNFPVKNLENLAKWYDLVVIDTFTDISNYIRRSFAKGKEYISQPQWWTIKEILNDFIIRVRDMNCHVIIICHESIETDAEKIALYLPDVDTKLRTKIWWAFDIVARHHIIDGDDGQPQYKIKTDWWSKRPTKSRYKRVQEVEADLGVWIDCVNSNYKAPPPVNPSAPIELAEDEIAKIQTAMEGSNFENFESAKKMYIALKNKTRTVEAMIESLEKASKDEWQLALSIDYVHVINSML